MPQIDNDIVPFFCLIKGPQLSHQAVKVQLLKSHLKTEALNPHAIAFQKLCQLQAPLIADDIVNNQTKFRFLTKHS